MVNETLTHADLSPQYTYIVFGVLTMFTNAVIFFVLFRNKELLRKSAFVLGLTIADFIEGLWLITDGLVKIYKQKSGGFDIMVHPFVCNGTPLLLHLMGIQIPGVMFILIGVERFVAVYWFTWYYLNWNNKLAYLSTLLAYVVCLISLITAITISALAPSTYKVSFLCTPPSVIGTTYTLFHHGSDVLGGIVSAVATIFSLIKLRSKKNSFNNSDVNPDLKRHARAQWRISVTMFSLSVLDLALVVVPNVVIILSATLKVVNIGNISGITYWALLCISIRSCLNLFVYLSNNQEFRTSALKAFGLEKRFSATVSTHPNPSRISQKRRSTLNTTSDTRRISETKF